MSTNKTIFLSILFSIVISSVYCQPLRNKQVEDYIINKHFLDMIKGVYPQAEELSMEYSLKYYVPITKKTELQCFIRERELRKKCYDYVFADSLLKRVKCKMEIDSIYRDSINTILISTKNRGISGDNISYALQYSKLLDINKTQYNELMQEAIIIARILYAKPQENIWDKEMEVLARILNKKQFTNFFLNKNADIVTKAIESGWKKLEEAGLTEKLDSINDINKAYTYYHKRQRIKDVYRYHNGIQKRQLAELRKAEPLFVRLLEALKEKEEIEKSNNIGKEFIW